MNIKRMLVAVVVLCTMVVARAQQFPPVPVDENVKIGKLENGLTYYLRHNEYPEHVASFFIAQKVGSVNEEEDQRGLAHLLEHLAFNGTDHFPGNSLQEYLQSIGVEYGRNLNAYTACDQTVYHFTDVPTKRATAIDSCMLILKDWSNGISLTQQAIDDERDVVHNEYRMRMVGQQRILERALPQMYPGSIYGERMPIGLMSVIDGCSPEAIRSYYRKWYRPDNQAIIIVGDIDVDQIEQKIKDLFSDIVVPADAAQVLPVEVPNNNEAIHIVDKEKEMQVDLIMTFIKHEVMPAELKGTMAYQLQQYVSGVACMMLDQRLSEKALDPACPYLQAGCSEGEYLMSRTKDAFMMSMAAKPGMVKETLAAVLTEAKRAHDFGFTATEYSRAKEEFMSQIEKAYTNRDKMKNGEFTDQYVAHFINNEPIPSVETEYKIFQQLSQMLPIDVVNMVAKEMFCETDTNLVTLTMMKEVDGATYPTPAEMAEVVNQVRQTQLEAYVDNAKQEPLIAKAPKAGKIKKVKEDAQFGTKELTLSNGVKVVLKKTDFKDDEIVLAASAQGGTSAIKFNNPALPQLAGQLVGTFGLGNFSSTELEKALSGKQVSASLTLSDYSHGVRGRSTPKDIETMMQLVYLNMTALAKDEKSFASTQQMYASILANASSNPQMVYQDSVASTLYNGDPEHRLPTAEMINALTPDDVLNLYQKFTAKAKDYIFYIVGNFEEATLLPLIETYIASLPNKGASIKNKQVAIVDGELKNIFEKKQDNPATFASEVWRSKPMSYNLRNVVTLDIANRLLDMAYNRSIRETLSASYHAGSQDQYEVNADKSASYIITASAQLNPAKADEAIPHFFSDLDATIAQPNLDDLQKVKEILLKQADVDAKTNSYWIGVLSRINRYGQDFHTDYKKTIQETDAKMISDFLQNVMLKSGNHAEIIMKPAE